MGLHLHGRPTLVGEESQVDSPRAGHPIWERAKGRGPATSNTTKVAAHSGGASPQTLSAPLLHFPHSEAPGLLHHHRHHAVVCRIQEELLLPLPWNGEVDVVFINNRTCDRVRRCCPFVAPEPIVIKIFYALLQVASERLPQQQEPPLVGFGISSRLICYIDVLLHRRTATSRKGICYKLVRISPSLDLLHLTTSRYLFEEECQGLADLNTGLVALISMQLLKLVHQLINMLGSRQKSKAIVSIPKEMKQVLQTMISKLIRVHGLVLHFPVRKAMVKLRYAHHVGFSVKIESSRRCAKDGELDKFVYVCNKSGKPREEEAVPVKQRNRKLTVLTDCKAKLRVKRDGARWKVTQFVEVHTHEVIDKFVLKKYLSLVRFFKQYMKLQEIIDVTEDAHEFDGDEKTVRLWGDFPMEKQILQTYTMPIYNRFQLELRKITSYNVRDIGVTEQGSIHEVFPIQESVRGYGRRSYRVDADVANGIYNCECCKINRDGILCCHAMKVMSHLGMVTKYPEHYILPRWCLPPPDIVAPRDERQEKPVGQKLSRKDMRLLRYGNLCSDFAKLAVGLAASEKTNEIAERHMRAMEKEMADLKKANADALKKRKSAKHPVNTNPANDSQESVPMEEDAATVENQKARNPPVVA
ncbi:hypothetical protein QYE76_047642 [Lolium multiflorum]|uniref:Protein FAR1-RELATED SEQUENCE n=1 Tax=Lolium multiflorum TaxID=4521 RepID=A0AAD8X0D6_LOLMU|nr:hypothetical protein QYE76_047642 [Lolium multiflorum]